MWGDCQRSSLMSDFLAGEARKQRYDSPAHGPHPCVWPGPGSPAPGGAATRCSRPHRTCALRPPSALGPGIGRNRRQRGRRSDRGRGRSRSAPGRAHPRGSRHAGCSAPAGRRRPLHQAASGDRGGRGAFPIRFWNMLPFIQESVGEGLDRYMAFNLGRHDAFRDWAGGADRLASVVPTHRHRPPWRGTSSYTPCAPDSPRRRSRTTDNGRLGGTRSAGVRRRRVSRALDGWSSTAASSP